MTDITNVDDFDEDDQNDDDLSFGKKVKIDIGGYGLYILAKQSCQRR